MKTPYKYELFLSYSRMDNKSPVDADGRGWVKAFHDELKLRHRKYTGRELGIFFDGESIDLGVDWRRRIGEGLRQSRLFLAFLSPNYLISPNCLWEWEEYLRREHSAARGDDGITPVYFVTPDHLRLKDDQVMAGWLAEMEREYPWFRVGQRIVSAEMEQHARDLVTDVVKRRNKRAAVELQPWFSNGPEQLRELDAAARSHGVRAAQRDPAGDLRTLAERLAELDRHIVKRLNRLALADLAPGNVEKGHEHFVGRHKELRELHDIMLGGGPQTGGGGMRGRGMIATAFSPGGLGKTAFVRQYAHAYAEFYAAGGTWEIDCEGLTELGAALLRLAESPRFKQIGEDAGVPLLLSEAQRADFARAGGAVLHYLEEVTKKRDAVVREKCRRFQDPHCADSGVFEPEPPRALLILDNVDQPQLLSARELALVPPGDWLEIIVTTRLDPASLNDSDRVFTPLEISTLPEADGLQLLTDFQPGHRFATETEGEAALQIVRALGGWTIALEIAAAYIAQRAKQVPGSHPAAEFYKALVAKGLAWVDDLAGRAAFDQTQRHSKERALCDRERQNRVGTLIHWSMDRLSAPARTALEFACLLKPDGIPLCWLRKLTAAHHPEVEDASVENDHCWPAIWNELRGLRLLHGVGMPELDDRKIERLPELVWIHRLVAEHVAATGLESRRITVIGHLAKLTFQFEQTVGHAMDASLRRLHPWLRDHVEFLMSSGVPMQALLQSAMIAAAYEGEHGSLARAIGLVSRALAELEKLKAEDPSDHDHLRDVSVSLSKLGDFLARRGLPGDAEAALGHYRRSLEILEGLLEANPESAQAARDVSVSLSKLGDFLARRGLPGDAEAALGHYRRSLEIDEGLLEANPESAQAARDVSVSLNKLGDFLARRGLPGDAEAALGHYRRSLEIAQGLLEANQQSAQAARDVSVSLSKLGDFLARRGLPGDAEAALGHYRRSLEIDEGLLEANPESAQAARDVSVSLNKLGDFLARRGLPGDAEAALGHYRRSLEILEGLLEANPESAQAARDVSVSLSKLGDFLARRGLPGDAEAALGHYRRSLEIDEGLLEANPESAQAARDVSVSLNKLGDFLARRGLPGDAEAALGHYRRSLEIAQGLLEANQQSAQAARDVSVSLERLGDFLERRGLPGDAEEALGHYRRSLEIREGLLEANQQSAQAARDVSVSLNKLGDFLARRGLPGDAEEALGHCRRSLEILEGLLEANQQSAEAARDVLVAREQLASMRARQGDVHAAMEEQEQALGLARSLWERNQSYEAGRTLAISALRVGQFAQAAGERPNAVEGFRLAYEILDGFSRAGVQLDAELRGLYDDLKMMVNPGSE